MTNKIAIDRLHQIALNLNIDDEAPLFERTEAIGLAVVALKRQMPKKIIGPGFGDRGDACPSCKERVSIEMPQQETFYCNYCPRCGQKLKWG